MRSVLRLPIRTIFAPGLHRISVYHFISSVCLMHLIGWCGTSQSGWSSSNPIRSPHTVSSINHMWCSYTRSGVTRSLLLFMYDCCAHHRHPTVIAGGGGGGWGILCSSVIPFRTTPTQSAQLAV